jgi:hypothetical protein
VVGLEVGSGVGSVQAPPFCTVLAESLAVPRAEPTFTMTFLMSTYPHSGVLNRTLNSRSYTELPDSSTCRLEVRSTVLAPTVIVWWKAAVSVTGSGVVFLTLTERVLPFQEEIDTVGGGHGSPFTATTSLCVPTATFVAVDTVTCRYTVSPQLGVVNPPSIARL